MRNYVLRHLLDSVARMKIIGQVSTRESFAEGSRLTKRCSRRRPAASVFQLVQPAQRAAAAERRRYAAEATRGLTRTTRGGKAGIRRDRCRRNLPRFVVLRRIFAG